MNNSQPVDVDEESSPAHHQASSIELEQLIEGIGARYISDLRTLSEELGHYYTAQLRAKDEQIGQLTQRLEVVQRERDNHASRIRELERSRASYVSELRALGDQLRRRIEAVEHEQEAPELDDLEEPEKGSGGS